MHFRIPSFCGPVNLTHEMERLEIQIFTFSTRRNETSRNYDLYKICYELIRLGRFFMYTYSHISLQFQHSESEICAMFQPGKLGLFDENAHVSSF